MQGTVKTHSRTICVMVWKIPRDEETNSFWKYLTDRERTEWRKVGMKVRILLQSLWVKQESFIRIMKESSVRIGKQLQKSPW